MHVICSLIGMVVILVVLAVLYVGGAWILSVVVSILTRGRVDLDWQGKSSEWWLTSEIGFWLLLLTAGLIASAVHH